jgi:hypothetical protein
VIKFCYLCTVTETSLKFFSVCKNRAYSVFYCFVIEVLCTLFFLLFGIKCCDSDFLNLISEFYFCFS